MTVRRPFMGRKFHAPSSTPPGSPSKSLSKSTMLSRKGLAAIAAVCILLGYKLLDSPYAFTTDLLAGVSLVDASPKSGAETFADLLNPTSRRKANMASPTTKVRFAAKDLPSDWSSILKLRQKFKAKTTPAPQQPATNAVNIPNYKAREWSILRRPEKTTTKFPSLLLRTDALYQKETWDKSPIILEKYKLVFFSVPKVGCTGFKQLFRRMMGFANWRDHQYYQQPFLPHNPIANGLKYLSDYPMDRANEMLTSPEWTRAIFVRKPDERVLSAFLDKAVNSKGYYLRMKCCGKFHPASEESKLLQCATGIKRYTAPQPGELNLPIMQFEQFVGKILPVCSDPHWEPQNVRMAPKYWEKINFLGRFENLYEDTKRLLTQVGAWEKYGASGWVVDGQDGAIFDPRQHVAHKTSAQESSIQSSYFTPKAVESILNYYSADYEHEKLNFEKPKLA